MKKTIIYSFIAILVCALGFSFFYNGFSGIQSMTIQKYDEPIEKGKITTDKEKIKTITGILNRSNRVTANYELVYPHDYKIQLKYKDGKTEVLYVNKNFGLNITLFVSDVRDSYKINDKQTKKILDLLLN
ncbi:hypothetical protein CSE16_10060 [Solibacillus sp. R5-41]|uniref:hypothetical protein n=1 Tax=Solibacillus sp. R5-41 TaxID=2048654 RepID=UPI000C126860|nr:hypothetical protein [Solibacillus sp. R5-41]ATP40362.1 hypothetical protein CSE16_10060 [Solibacillus sp. R5-41]